jgi:hypothetical protein
MLHLPRTPGCTRHAIWLALVVLAVASSIAALTAPAASADRPFAQRFGQVARGDVRIAANSSLSCPSSGATNGSSCLQTRNGTGTILDNAGVVMTNIDVDLDLATFNSSTADLTLPAGATVLYAGLYWGADTSAGAGGAAAPSAAARNTVKFKVPGGLTYSTVTALQVDQDDGSATRYQGIADVTTAVQGTGSGTYAVANVQAGTGNDRYGGWALAVAYSVAGNPIKWVGLYDGLDSIGSGSAGPSGTASATLSGFLAPASGTVAADLGMVGYEGEIPHQTGESVQLNGVAEGGGARPIANPFNASITNQGVLVTTRNPSYTNNLGFDAGILDADGEIANSSTTATVIFNSGLDLFLPGLLTLVTDTQATAPVNTVLPAITGTVQTGQVLTAGDGTWTGTPTITYARQWQRCNGSGASCANIAGATGTTYTVAGSDEGSTFRVVVTATNVVGSVSATSNASAVATAVPPSNTALPTISGTTQDGQTLTATTGTWNGTPPFTYTYQWRSCDSAGANCSDIAGATSSTYVLQPSDIGRTVRVVVTAANSGGSVPATSGQSAVVTAIPPANTVLPSISGTPQHGQTLTASNGTWTGSPTITYTYQWRRCDASGASCADIAGATSGTYVVQQADVTSPASTIRVVVTADNAAPGTVSATSNQTSSVAATPPVNTVLPAISGTPEHGQTLTTTNGTWTGTTPITYTYQWRRCDAAGASCVDIAGATASTYVVQQADVTTPASTIRVVVTADNPAPGTVSATSNQTSSVVATPPVNTVLPAISGTPEHGQTLTATSGTWTGTTPITFTYQWRRCDAAGASCVDIAGATASTYVVQQADVTTPASTIRVVVTADNPAPGTVSATSNQTSSVVATPPVNTVLPVISGTPQHGQTLTTTNGTWTGTTPITFTYQWRRCDASGASCADIAGATSSTYVVQQADVTSPASTIRVVVTADNAAPGTVSATSNQTSSVSATPPVNTVLPAISGTPEHGQTLTATSGTWTGTTPITYSYQWRRCDSAGANCADIAGATASTYVVQQADVTTPASTIRVVVTADNAAPGTVSATSNQTSSVVATPPVNTVLPTISGTAQHGQTLTATSGTWTGTTPITFTYQWRRCDAAGASCVDIAGATGGTYVVQQGDVTTPASTIRVVVTADNAAPGTVSATSNQTSSVAAAPPVNTVLPTISGTPEHGQTLTASNGTWTGTTPITFTYQWRRCDSAGANCADISGATSSTYVVQQADVTSPASTIRVVVTADNAAPGTVSATSNQTSSVAATPPVNTVLPTISGTAQHGQMLTATSGTWTGTTPITYTYQWRRCDASGASCADIAGATATTYVVQQADVTTPASTIRVVVTADNPAPGTVSATSNQTSSVAAAPPVNTVLPTVSGTPEHGQTLTASNGTWTGTAPISYSYQWRRCDAAGASCADIAGATATTYVVQQADVTTPASTIRVVVTADNVAPGTVSATSNQTSSVVATPPVNTVLPAISGTPEHGQTLTASTGTWTGTTPITFTYQWRRCDAAGAICVDIAGATGGTYVVQQADVTSPASTIRVVVTADNAAPGTVSATSNQTSSVVATPPVNTVLPVISGTPQHGQMLSASNGTWTGTTPMTFTYQWRRCDSAGANCVSIAGATSQTYTVQQADVTTPASTLRVVVFATNSAAMVPATSNQTSNVTATAPVNTIRPVISGSAQHGQTLTTTNGTWDGTTPMTFTYQWRRCDASGNGCADIAGATSQTYVVQQADVTTPASTIRVVVTAANSVGSTPSTSNQTASVSATPPVNTVLPVISGTPQHGQTLTTANGTWTGTTPMTFAYQWRRCNAAGASCADIAGATASTYVVQQADVTTPASTIRVVVTATNAAGSTPATSNQTSAVTPTAPVNTAPPTITGTPRDGDTLTAGNGTWSGTAPFTYGYQWRRCNAAGNSCADISGATGQTYVVTPSDVTSPGSTIRVVVTATNAASNASAPSAPTAEVTGLPPVNTALPVVSGVREEGQTLSATSGTWTGTPTIGYAYGWVRCDTAGANCSAISGAGSSTYALQAADVGSTVRVVVVATNLAGNDLARSAVGSVVAPAAPVNTGGPTISGTPTDGQTLTADPGTWTGSAPITFTYQWTRCDAAGNSCVNIPGADEATYDLTPTDVGSTIRVVVTADNPAPGTVPATSSPTAVVAARPPVNTVPPAISGTTQAGSTLTSTTGTWTGTPTITYARQWQRCDESGANCADVLGASGVTYDLTAADVGSTMKIVVSATNAGGSDDAASSATGEISPAPPVTIPPSALVPGPSISGTPRDGDTLTATTGTWGGTAPFSYGYQWLRCNSAGSSCSPIALATSSTYVLTPSDVGATIRVTVTATNGAGNANATAAQTAVVTARPPVNTVDPTISGTTEDGSTLTAGPGTWTGTPTITYTYQWQRCAASCANVTGATGTTYPLGAADVGSKIRVVVTAANAGGSASDFSSQSATVTPEAPSNTAVPTIAGTPRDGLTLTASPGTWDGTAPIAHTYQWQRCDSSGANCANVSGATAATYPLAPGDVGTRMRVVVTGTNAGGSATGTSVPTAIVVGNPPVNTVLPTVSGTALDGQTLGSTLGTWTGTPTITYTRQWLRCDTAGASCQVVPGATASTYALIPADVGKRLRLSVTGTNMAGAQTVTSSNMSGVVGAIPPVSTGDPDITGTPKEGETLTGTPGTWTGTAPFDHTYQWQRCDENGANCVDVPGADDPTYQLGPGDVEHTMRVVVTTTNGGGSSSATSDPTAKVVGLPGPPDPPPTDPKPPVNDGKPAVTGDPKPGSLLTGDPGHWSPTPSGLGYQWERCDASGANCQPIPGATSSTYTPTDADDGSRLRVTVTASNDDGSRQASSDATDVIHRAQPPADDLGEDIGGSFVSPENCTRIAAGTGVKRKRLAGFGTVKVLLRASAYINTENPLRLSTSASNAGNLKAVKYLLDGRTMGQPKRKPYWQDIKPAALSVSGGDAHKVAVTLMPKRGRAVVWTFDIKTRPCDNLLSTTQWKTGPGAGLRLRVDSRGALGPVKFTVPAAMLPKVGRDAGKGVGRVRYFTKAGAKPFTLRMTKPKKGVLLDGEGKPRVELVRGGAVVTNLPEGVGIVELTLYTQKATSPTALLSKGKKATFRAQTTSAGAAVNLSAVLVGRGR